MTTGETTRNKLPVPPHQHMLLSELVSRVLFHSLGLLCVRCPERI
jgi:hypothetical protein